MRAIICEQYSTKQKGFLQLNFERKDEIRLVLNAWKATDPNFAKKVFKELAKTLRKQGYKIIGRNRKTQFVLNQIFKYNPAQEASHKKVMKSWH